MGAANITWLTEDLATGGDFSFNMTVAAAQLDEIIDGGVTHVIDMRLEASDEEVWAHIPEVTYTNIQTDDVAGSNLEPEVFDQVVAIARAAKAAGGKVLVHCHMGVNRGPSAALAVLMDRGMHPADAYELIAQKRPQAAMYYAMDALGAHHIREDTDPAQLVAEVFALVAAIEHRWSDPDALDKVHHIIREHHKKDARELRDLGSKGGWPA